MADVDQGERRSLDIQTVILGMIAVLSLALPVVAFIVAIVFLITH